MLHAPKRHEGDILENFGEGGGSFYNLAAFLSTFYAMLSGFCKHSKHMFGWCWTFPMFYPYFTQSLDNRWLIWCSFLGSKNKVTCHLWNLHWFDFVSDFIFGVQIMMRRKTTIKKTIDLVNTFCFYWPHVCRAV